MGCMYDDTSGPLATSGWVTSRRRRTIGIGYSQSSDAGSGLLRLVVLVYPLLCCLGDYKTPMEAYTLLHAVSPLALPFLVH